MQAMEISLSALDVEWRRMEVSAQNLANMNSAGTAGKPLYQEQTLLSGPRPSFEDHLNDAAATDGAFNPAALNGVTVYGVQSTSQPPRLVHEPGNPQADKDGMVAYPNIDHAGQMLQMVKSSRVYEANIAALNAAHEMYTKALELGKR